MPNIFSVNFTFEAEDLADAEAIIGTWVITPGATLNSLQGTINPAFPPTVVGADGRVGSAVAKAKMAQPPPAPPLPATPPTVTPARKEK